MLLTQLKYFVALAKEQHFGRAAESCHISQSALSEAIHKLEIELDVRLVRRGKAFEGITPEGERLLLWARRMVSDEEALRDSARVIRSGLTGTLRLGVVPSAVLSAAHLVDQFITLHPQVSVRLESNLRSEEITRRIQHFELDAGIVYPVKEQTTHLTVCLLYQERQCVVLSSALSEGRTRIEANKLATLTLGLLSREMRGRRILDEGLRRKGIILKPRLTADSIGALFELAASGRVAVIVPLPPGSPALPQGVVTLNLTEPEVSAPIVFATIADEPVSPLARAMMQIARSGVA